MAQLKDLLVSGVSRFVGKLFANEVQLTTLNIPTASNGSTYGPGTSGQVLATNNNSVYWKSLTIADIGGSTVLPVSLGGTGATVATKGGVVYGTGTTYGLTAAGTSGYLLQSGGTGTPTWINATNANTASTIVKRDASGNFSAGTITATLSGNASSASKLGTADVGNATQPIYLDDGVPKAATAYSGASVLSASKFTAAQSVTLTGDVTGTASSVAGWSIATTLATQSGVTAGSYGLSADASPAHGGTFKIPYVTVNAKGLVTGISQKTITLPSDNNTDTNVSQTITTGDADYRILFSGTADDTTRTEGARKGTNLRYNPSTSEIKMVNGTLWVQGGSNAGSSSATNRLTLTSGMPVNLAYNTSKRGTRIYSNGIAFADPYNGNSNNDSGWIRQIEETSNSGTLEIATGDDSNETIVVRQYNTSSAVASEITLLNSSHQTLLNTTLPRANNTYNLGSTDAKWANIYATTFTGNLVGNVTGNVTGSLTGPASKLGTQTVGATDRPIYLSSGVPNQTTYRMAATNAVATTARAITDNLETGIWYVNGTNSTDLYSISDGAAYVNKYNDNWIAEIYYDYRTGQIALRGKNNGTWQDWRKVLDSSNYTTWTVTKTGSGASGTWGISITGNAATATTASKLGTAAVGSSRQPVYWANGIPTTANYTVAHLGNAGKSNMNDVGRLHSSAGMTNLTDPSNNTDNPMNGTTKSTGWHLYWDTNYTDDPNGTNSWVAQIVNKAGTNQWWVRSRSGGTITNGTAWNGDWRHLVVSPQAGQGGSTTPIYIDSNGHTQSCTSYANATVGTAVTANKLGSGTVGSASQPVYFSNGVPTVTSGVLSSQIYDSKIQFGNDNFAGTTGVIDTLFNNKLRGNRFAGFKPAGATIEYSTDGGSTWTNYGASDTVKQALFTTNTSLRLVPSGNVTANSQLRITMDTGAGWVYTVLRKIMIYVSTNYSSNCTVTIEAALQNAPTNYTLKICENQPIAGWSGWNVIQCNFTTYGNTATSQYGRIRFTFKHSGVSSGHEAQGLIVQSIYGYGGMGWTTPSTLAATDHVYSYDQSLNTTFPAHVTATQFNGPLNGTATKATQDGSGNTITSTYVKKAGDSMTGNLTANGAVTLGTPANPWHQLVLGGTTNATMTADSTNPRITFQENTGTQPVHLIYSDQDSYRAPAGLKVIGGTSATPAWFEVEGNIYAAAFKGTADVATKLGTSDVGSTYVPIYLDDGTAKACTSPSLLTNLASTTAANVFAQSPRPGVTGVLGLANGGTGKTSAADVFSALSWTAGTTAGPTLSVTVVGQNRTATIPSASNTASGIITIGDQNLKGTKTLYDSNYVMYHTQDNNYVQGFQLRSLFDGANYQIGGLTATYAGGSTSGTCQLELGTLNSAKTKCVSGLISIYSGTSYVELRAGGTRTVRSQFYFPNYDGYGYFTHTQSAAAVGNSYTPVYVAANGRVTACSDMDSRYVNVSGDTMTGALTIKGLKATSGTDYGTTLPTSGTEGQVFFQISDEQYEIPTGGTTGQALIKNSNTDRDVKWGSIGQQKPGTAKFYPSGSTSTTANTGDAIFNTSVYVQNSVLFGAAWNDYAEYRETTTPVEAGRVVVENGDDTLSLSIERMQPGAEIVSDTFGFAIGQTEKSKTAIAASGRVLAYPHEPRRTYKPGQPVCSGPNGTVSQMTDEEARIYPWCIIGTVSSIPEYDTWGEENIQVNGRIWIRIR